MRRLLLLSFALLSLLHLSAPGPNAQSLISVWADPAGTLCEASVPGPGAYWFYVVHSFVPGGVLGSHFAITYPPELVYLDHTPGIPFTQGDPVSGLTACYGHCRTEDVLVTSLLFFASLVPPTCSSIPVVPGPGQTQVLITDCEDNILPASAWWLTLNSDGTCPCLVNSIAPADLPAAPAEDDPFAYCRAVPVETHTWGGIKALYE